MRWWGGGGGLVMERGVGDGEGVLTISVNSGRQSVEVWREEGRAGVGSVE